MVRLSCRIGRQGAKDSSGGDLLALGSGGERGERRDFGHGGVGDPAAGDGVEDGVGVVDRRPRLVVYPGDGLGDLRGGPGGDREPGPGRPGRGHHLVLVVGRVRTDRDQPERTAAPGGGHRVGDQPGRTMDGGHVALAQPDPATTGALIGVDSTASWAFRPLTFEYP